MSDGSVPTEEGFAQQPESPPTRLDASSPRTRLEASSPRARVDPSGPDTRIERAREDSVDSFPDVAASPATRLDSTPTPRDESGDPGDETPLTRVESASSTRNTTSAYVSHNLPPGLQAGYSIIRELGRGSEAFVFLCESESGEQVAIKLYHHTPGFAFDPRDVRYRDRFTKEHAVQLLDRGQDHGVSFEVLEYCAGGTLADLLARSPRTGDAKFALEVLVELSEALATLQSDAGGQRLVHADIKPSNILVRTVEPLDLVFTDFGLTVDLEGRTHMTNTGAGTVAYAAPGSAFSHRAADDWWSLGMVLFEVIIGRAYFQSADGRHLDERTIEEQLAVRDIDVSEVGDSGIDEPDRWMRLLSGLLTRDYSHRWGVAEVRKWLAGESPEVYRVATTVTTGASAGPTTRATEPLVLWGDTTVQTPHELGVAFAEEPRAAARAVTGTEINRVLKWLWNDAGLDDPLSGIQASWQAAEIVAYITARLAPEQSIVYCGYDISTTSLLQQAVLAAAGSIRSGSQHFGRRLYEARLLGALVDPVYRPMYDSLDANWHDVTQFAYDEANSRQIQLSVAATNAIRDKALHALASEGARKKILDDVDRRIAAAPRAREVDWFDELAADLASAQG